MNEVEQIDKLERLLILTSRLQESIKHLEEDRKELKQALSEINTELSKKSEEIRDAYYVSERVRERLDEYQEVYQAKFEHHEKIYKDTITILEELKKDLNTVESDVVKLEDKNNNKLYLIVAAITTGLSIGIAIIVKFYGKV